MNQSRKSIIAYYLYSFFIGVYLANGTTVLFARVLGFSFSRIFILSAVYMLMFVLFEIPSGAFADLIGRKRTVMIGCGALVAGAIATGLSNTFVEVFWSFFLWAFGFSMVSGADEAMLYDRLNEPKIYAQVIGRAHFFALIGTAIAGIVGPLLYIINFRYAYLGSAVPFLLGGTAVYFFDESHQKGEFSLAAHLTQIKVGVKLAIHNRFVLWSVAMMSLSFGILYTLSNSYQPYLRNIGFSVHAFSIILPVMFSIQALGGWSSGKILNWLGESKIFIFSVIGVALFVGFLGAPIMKLGVIFLLAYTFLQGLLQPAISIYTNRHIDSSYRATIISVQGMVATVTAATMLFLFGFLTDRLGLSNLFILLGVLIFASGAVILFLKPRDAA